MGFQLSTLADRAKQDAALAEQKRIAADKSRQVSEMQDRGQGYRAVDQGSQERAAGVLPPGYEGTRDRLTGELLGQYKSDAYDGEALQKLKGEAFGDPNESAWSKMQMTKQGQQEAQGKDQAAKSQAQAMAQAQGNLMRQGGMSGGARLRMAQQGIKDTAKAQQNVAQQGINQRMGIQEKAIDRQGDLLGKFGNAEQAANEANIGRSTQDLTKSSYFDMERYKQQMAAYGAKESANAQRAAAGGGGGKK